MNKKSNLALSSIKWLQFPRKRFKMDLRKLKTLIDLVSESNVSELEITEAEGKVRIVKAGLAAPAVAAVPVQAVPVAAPAAVAAPVAAAPAEPAVTGHVVKSPMVGTFYRSSSPAASPSSRWARRSRKATPSASSRP
jgi:acetyl-CoA carboxylase biotin carboxyl carrier protein